MTDELFRSMKSQMVPSDDVVNDLLAKIAALDASPETADNVVSFDESRFVRTTEFTTAKPAKKAKKSTTKSIWFYGTAAAASTIVLLSTFAMFGGDSADVQQQFGDIIDNPGIVTDSGNIGENAPDPGVASPVDSDSNDEEQLPNPEGNANEGENDSDNEQIKDSHGKTSSEGKSDEKQGESNTPAVVLPTQPDKTTPPDQSSVTAPPPAPSGSSNSQSGTIDIGDSKVTPGAAGTSEISWKREILSESSVSNIRISGSNYVVDSVASSPSVASSTEVQKISLEIPETSVTHHTTVDAKVKKVKNVSEELMVAVDAEGFKETLLYTNKDYSPSSLGQFIADAGLSQGNTSFAKAVYLKGEKIGYSSYQRKNVDDIKELATQYILSNKDASTASYGSYNNGTVHVLFKSSKNPTQGVIDFGVSDNGYLYVKMASGNSFTFHIGAENANSFISIVTGM